MHPKFVKRFSDTQKNDARDAEACHEAVTSSKTKFSAIKTVVQIELQNIHRVRSFFVKQKTALMNTIRGLLLEHGIAIPKGESKLNEAFATFLDEADSRLSRQSKLLFNGLYCALKNLTSQVAEYSAQLKKLSEEEPLCQQLLTIPGVGPITASALVCCIGNGSGFKNGRGLSAFMGIVPKQNSSGDKTVLLGITKHGDRYIRQLLIHGGRACINAALKKHKLTGEFIEQDAHSTWIRSLTTRCGKNKAAVAIANKNCRIAIAMLKNQVVFDARLAH